jgi:Ras family protein
LRNEKVIYKEKGEKLARRYGMKFFETSSLKNINVKKAFESLIYFILDVYK